MTQYRLTLTKTIDADDPLMDFCYDDTTEQLVPVERMADELKRMFDIGYVNALNVLQDATWIVEEVSTNRAQEIALAIDPMIATDKKPGVLFVLPDTIRLAHLVDDLGWDRAKQHEDVRRLLQRIEQAAQ